MTYSQQDGARESQPERAAIFVDYGNLYRTLDRMADNGADRADLISEMIDALQRSLIEDRRAQSAVARAYADFTSLLGGGERIQRTLYLQGVEPHYVPDSRKESAVELQLCVDAMDLLHHRSDISTFVLLTGRRIYLPLIRMFRRYGRAVLVASLEEPEALDDAPPTEDGWFFPARDLLSAATRRGIKSPERSPRAGITNDRPAEIDDPILIQTLEIIDDHFGQYEEVYLTPLLRKLSELLDERRYDPKNLISDLEDYRAVRLEKRQGFPHDYTVLILEELHPSVARVLSGERRPAEHYRDEDPHEYDARVDTDLDDAFRHNGQADYEDDDLDDAEAYDYDASDVDEPEAYDDVDDPEAYDDASDVEDFEETNPPV